MGWRLADLYCGAGGTGMGFYRAGFTEIVGVDIERQKNYPFDFVQGDALNPPFNLLEFDAIAAAPPCQGYSRMRHLPWLRDREYPMLIEPTRELLRSTGLPYIIENVEDAPLLNGVTLCGLSFGLPLYRHRKFESNYLLMAPPHTKHQDVIHGSRFLNKRYSQNGGVVGVVGKVRPESTIVTVCGHTSGVTKARAQEAMGIDWMTRDELTQAIPPAYTEFLGRQLLDQLARVA